MSARAGTIAVGLVVLVVGAFLAGRAELRQELASASDAAPIATPSMPYPQEESTIGPRAVDAGAPIARDAGEPAAPRTTEDTPAAQPSVAPPPPIDSSPRVAFDRPQTVEDEYDRATMLWDLVQARRGEIRTQLSEARRIGDQEASERLARQLAMLEVSDREMAAAVHAVEARRAASDPAHGDPAAPAP